MTSPDVADQFAPAALQFWTAGADLHPDRLTVQIDDGLPDNRAVSLLTMPAGTLLRLRSELADRIGTVADETEARRRLTAAGIRLNEKDLIHHLPLSAPQRHRGSDGTRVLTAEDAELFAGFTDRCSADDLDEAYVELDHWLVHGAFDGTELVAAASAYPWFGSTLADIGVITRPDRRGLGHGRRVVASIAADLLARDHEPLYRCQPSNVSSAALARSGGFTVLGQWEVLAD